MDSGFLRSVDKRIYSGLRGGQLTGVNKVIGKGIGLVNQLKLIGEKKCSFCILLI